MKKILFVVSMLGLAVGCGGNVGDEILGKMESTKKAVCACKELACAEKAEADFEKFIMGKMKDAKDFKPSKAQDEKADKLQDEMRACKKKLEEAAAPPAAPAGDAPAPQ